METPPCKILPEGIRLAIHLQPGAKRTAFSGMYGDRLKIAVGAPPENGRANSAAIRFLADYFDVAVRDVELLSGATSRNKMFLIRGNPAELNEKLKECMQ